MKAYDTAKNNGEKNPAASLKGMTGYYRCCVYKWEKVRQRDNWSVVCQCAPNLAKRYKELPNFVRKFMGKKPKHLFRRGKEGAPSSTCILPDDLQDAVAELVAT